MISSLDSASMSFLNGLDQIQRRATRAQTELSTGLKINSVADSPGQVSLLAQLHAQLEQTQQVNSNLTQVKSEVDSGESTLQSAVTLLEQAESLTTQGQSGFASSATRQEIADQLGTVMQQMVNLANTSVSGRYLFSGDSDQTAPYSIDLTQANPVSAYAGTAATRQIQGPDGSTFAVSMSGQDIFDSTDGQTNVFQALNNARTALLNNDQAGIDAVLPQLQTANTYLNDKLAFYGNAQNNVANAITSGTNLVTRAQTQLAGIQDADAAQAITEMTQAQTQQQAALAAFAKIPRSTLFSLMG